MADVRSRNSPGKYLRDAQKSTPPITAKFSSTHKRYACSRLSPVCRAIPCTAADCLNSAVSSFSSSPAASRDSRASCRPKSSCCGSDLTYFFCCGGCSCARSGTKIPERATPSRASPQTRGLARKTFCKKFTAHPPPVAARGARSPLPESILAVATPASPFPCPIRYPAWPPEPAPELFCALPLPLLPALAEQPAGAPPGCGTPSLEPRVGVAHIPWYAPRRQQYRPAPFPPPLRSCCGAPPRPVAAAYARLRYTRQTATSAESRSVLTRAVIRLTVAASRPWVADRSRRNEGYKTYKTNIRGTLCQFDGIDFLAVSPTQRAGFYARLSTCAVKDCCKKLQL